MRRGLGFMVALIGFAASAWPQLTGNDVVIDDFEADTLEHWQNSTSPEYYQGGEGNEALSIVTDPERGRVMRAAIGFGDANKSEAVWITRGVDQPIPLARIVTASFRYKLSGVTEAPINSLKLRLRTAPDAFTDYEVLPEDGVPLERWVQVTVPVRERMPAHNIYRYIFGKVQQVTLRLDDIDDHNAQFALLVDELRITLDQPRVESYQPTRRELRRDERLDVLLITQSAAGYYGIEDAARAIDPNARVDRYLFRGLHFPLWGFPERAEGLLGYDVIVLVDVDPWVMTAEQAQWLADLTWSGAGLIVYGGPNTLTHAREFKLPLREALPVSFEQGAKQLGGGTPVPGEHPVASALPPAGLGSVPAMHDLALREGAQAAFTVGDRPLVTCGQFGDGPTAVVNCWPSTALPLRDRFLTSDLADDLTRALLRRAWGREPSPRLVTLDLPPRTIVGAGDTTVNAAAQGPGTVRLMMDEPQDEHLGEQMVACRVEVVHAGGQMTDWRDFTIQRLAPLGAEVAWAAHQCVFAPGGLVEFSLRLSRRGMPALTPSGSSLNLSFASGALPVSCSGLTDMWVIPAGTDKVLHDQLGPDELKTTEAAEDLLQTVTTTGITRAGRPDMKFGDDDRIQRVERVARVRNDGSVRVTSRYEFLQDVRVSRITTMIALPAGTYAGMPFVAEQGGERTEGELPAADGKKVLDGAGLDLTIRTPSGPLRIQVLDPSLHVWMQDLRRYGADQFRIEIESPFEGKLARKGEMYEIPVLISGPPSEGAPVPPLADLSLRCELRDPATAQAVMSWPDRPAAGDLSFATELPNLRSGDYDLTARVVQGDRIIVVTHAPLRVVDPLERADFYPIMTVLGERGGGQEMDPAMALARLDDIIAHGFNAITHGNARSLAQPALSQGSIVADLVAAAAQARGLATFFEYHRLTLIGDERVEPCVFDPAHREKLRAQIEPQLDVCRRVPRLLSIKILDEPSMAAKNLDLCERCRAQFRGRYGAELRGPDEVGEHLAARWRLAEFLGEYLRAAYRMTRETKEEMGGEYELLLTFNSPGLGYGRGWTSRQDILSAGAEAGRMDFDIYPYFYPRSQKVRMVQCDFGLSMMREFARALDMPWGFYVELDDRNWPYQQNPPEASAECAWTAVAQGADYLNSFIHTGFGTGTGARPERWEMTGEALRTIRRIGPLLTRMSRPRAPVAMIYPMGQAMVRDGHPPADYAFECLRAGFGMVDAVSSEIIAQSKELHGDPLVLLGCDILERDVAELLVASWRSGGDHGPGGDTGGPARLHYEYGRGIVLDRVPGAGTDGEPLDLPWSFEGIEPRTLPGLDDCAYRVIETTYQTGRLTKLDFDLNETYRKAIEEDQFERAAALRRGVAALVSREDVYGEVRSRSSCFADDPLGQIEAGLRTREDAAMVIVVNHSPEENSGTIWLTSLGFAPAWACDLATMKPIALGAAGNGCDIPVTLAGRHSMAIALLPEAPTDVDLTVQTREVRPGGTLEYRVRVLNADGRPARGCHLLEIEVTGPDGEIVSRFGGSTATEGGVLTRSIPMPVNALAGEYRIEVRAPQAGATARGRFAIL